MTDKEVINDDGIVDVQKLTGQTLDRGNGTESTDVYKIERNAETNVYTLKYCVKPGEEEVIWNVTEEILSNVKTLTIKDKKGLVGDVSIQYEEGMTWDDWVKSSYNMIEGKVSNSIIEVNINGESVAIGIFTEDNRNVFVESSETIQEEYDYCFIFQA